jgi:outer membrane protein insertion porin family
VLLAVLLGGPATGSAQTSEDVVVDISVQGLRRVEADAVLDRIESEEGKPLDPVLLTADLRRVWESDFFRDIRIEKEPVEGGWRVYFVVVEKPSIKTVSFLGNDDVSQDDIEEVVDVKPFTILNKDKLKKNVDKIRDLYVEKGYYLADVDYRVVEIADNQHEIDVVFDIVENAKVVVKQLSFIGNHNIPSSEIKAVLQTREGDELSWLMSSGTYKEEFFQTDLFRIQALYYDRGYVTVKVGQPTATISTDRRYIYLAVPIEEGLQYSIGEITFSGEVALDSKEDEELITEEMLRGRLSIASGDTFNRTSLFEDIQRLTDVYRNQGYAYANVTPNSSVRAGVRKVDLDLEVERGDVVFFDRIEIVGNTRTRDKVIRREMRIYEGDKFNALGIEVSRARVFQLGFFETVDVTTNKGRKANTVDVTVEIKEKSTGTFQVGAGFSSVESFIATAQISQNNFLGTGQLLSVSAQLSFGDFARQLATLQFYEPYFLDSMWSFGLNAYITQRYYREFQRNASGFSPTFGYPITADLRVSAGYTLEWIEVEVDPNTGPSYADLSRGNGRNSSVTATVAYDTRDNRLFPTAGMYHVLTGEISDRAIGSEVGLEHRRLQLITRFYYPLPLGFVAKFNASIGLVFARGDERVAVAERFFPGGISSVRGFEPRGLGPTARVTDRGDPISATSDFLIGGNKEAVFNLELEVPILKSAGIKGVVFADAGNAYDDDEGFFYVDTPNRMIPTAYLMGSDEELQPPLGLYWSFGFGFRWFSPIGPLRFEWGIPITKRKPSDRDIIFEFTIGNFF